MTFLLLSYTEAFEMNLDTIMLTKYLAADEPCSL